jgi:hypothetical protein
MKTVAATEEVEIWTAMLGNSPVGHWVLVMSLP